jgi:hypothetical protein
VYGQRRTGGLPGVMVGGGAHLRHGGTKGSTPIILTAIWTNVWPGSFANSVKSKSPSGRRARRLDSPSPLGGFVLAGLRLRGSNAGIVRYQRESDVAEWDSEVV